MNRFNDKTILVTDKTGSFGDAVLDCLLNTDIKEIRVFIRDELKLDVMIHKYQAKCPKYSDKLKFYIGDVRDINSIKNAMHRVNYIFYVSI